MKNVVYWGSIRTLKKIEDFLPISIQKSEQSFSNIDNSNIDMMSLTILHSSNMSCNVIVCLGGGKISILG